MGRPRKRAPLTRQTWTPERLASDVLATLAIHVGLIEGQPQKWGPFRTLDDVRACWKSVREACLELNDDVRDPLYPIRSEPGRRPWAWWQFDSPERRDPGVNEPEQLRRMGVMGADESGRLLDDWQYCDDEDVEDWLYGEADKAAAGRGYTVDPMRGRHICEFIQRFLRLGEGRWAGQPFRLMEWQRNRVLMPLFSWVAPDGSRRFRDAYVSVPKKNGKSPTAAGVGLYLLAGDGEAGAKIGSVATEIQQAQIVHADAVRMVEWSEALSAELSVNRTTKQIYRKRERTSWYQALASSGSRATSAKEGLNLSGAIGDEIHVWQASLMDVLRYAFATRTQPLFFKITTAGVYDQTSVGWEEYQRACNVRDGITRKLDQFVYIAEAAKDEDWTDSAVWRRANPSLGITLREEELAAACATAQEEPRLENEFRRYRLNQWTEQATRWISVELWNECGGEFDESVLADKPCWGGLDLATVNDLAAFVLAFEDGDLIRLLCRFWAPLETARKRERRGEAPYATWGKEGWIELTEGGAIDFKVIHKRIVELATKYDVKEIAVDPHAAELTLQTLRDEHGLMVFKHFQGIKHMSGPTKTFERLLRDKRLRHGNNPVLNWMAQNVAVRMDSSEDMKPDKLASKDKIDGIIAAIMACGRAVLPHDFSSVYDAPSYELFV